MDSQAMMLDAARHRVPPTRAPTSAAQGQPRPQQLGVGDRRRGLPPRPPPPSRRGETRSGGAGKADEVRGTRDTCRGSGVATPGAADAAAVSAGDSGPGVAPDEKGKGVAELGGKRCLDSAEEKGGGDTGKRGLGLAAFPPPPKRRLVSATRLFPPGYGRDAAAPLAAGDDDSSLMGARAEGASDAPQKTALPLSVGKAGSSVMQQVESSADFVSAPIADNGHHGLEAELQRSSETLCRSGVPNADDLLDTDAQGDAGSVGFVRKESVPATRRLLPKPRMVSAVRRFPPGCGRPKASLVAGGGSTEVRLPLQEKDTAGFAKHQVVQAPTARKKCLRTDTEAAATSRNSFGPKKKGDVKQKSMLPSDVENDILKALAAHEEKYGAQNVDARSKVKMMRGRFEFIRRAIIRAVKQQSLKLPRIDLAAADLIKKTRGFTQQGPIVGNVLGIEVGDEFLYRVELNIVGLHRPYQGGIDTTRDKYNVLIAISVVASGGYPDQLSRSGELVYTGSGGKISGKNGVGDQKLEKGNLALKNCIRTKTPVRVIHRFNGLNGETPMFTYDGLYNVVDCWREGQPGSKVFKYKLQRIHGQAELHY
ncbi:hypothetical protein SORBI_3007G121200, partial [Sorghum bicolor]